MNWMLLLKQKESGRVLNNTFSSATTQLSSSLTTPNYLTTSTPTMTSQITQDTSCVDSVICGNATTMVTLCKDNYIASNYCPRVCGLCGKTN